MFLYFDLEYFFFSSSFFLIVCQAYVINPPSKKKKKKLNKDGKGLKGTFYFLPFLEVRILCSTN